MNNAILKLENIYVYYGEKNILNNINIDFEKNKITSIIGPSGCGKSTLLKTINKIILEEDNAIIKGNIYFDNKNTNDIPIEILRKNIGMVFQTPTPFPMTIYKNISYALKYYGFNKKDISEKITSILKMTNLYDEVKDKLNTSALKLSGGQKQRLCIARSLSIEPNILLLDEPCSSLDIINSNKIEDTLLSLKDKYTIIIVTHNIAQARRISDNSVFMYEGKVLESGKIDDIFNNNENNIIKNYIKLMES
ncbi:phosphate ABC transporter ATP-binding protein [Brachyspira sp. G79]|uniref:phosphate ABC transporter ATP-binding protein n=1 Tax=Brachyspira sp. G79 TaxID=1358104 RepID=UPI000BBC8D97|nr:phosphate ABC transporter ATP-binding protein [Brachyspira sp. G79]PCG20433.1 phosphate ABC transporter ATP-binding protein [Brachyspira sp. G79]